MAGKDWWYDKAIATEPGGYIAPLKRERANHKISENNPYAGLSRNKGARSGKKYKTSNNSLKGSKRYIGPSEARKRARQKARRAEKQQAYAQQQNAAGLSITNERTPSYRGGAIATDFVDMIHEGMEPCAESKNHRQFHEVRGLGIGKACA